MEASKEETKLVFAIEQDVLLATMNYLATKPYQEVFEFIEKLKECKPIISTTSKE